MYLEISPPCSGKTTRLFQHVGYYLSNNPEPYIAAIITKTKSRDITPHFNKGLHSRIYIDYDYRNMPHSHLTRYFFDDFDFLERVFIGLEHFYTTSLRKTRNEREVSAWLEGISQDPLLSLLALNGHKAVVNVALKKERKASSSLYKNMDPSYYGIPVESIEENIDPINNIGGVLVDIPEQYGN